MWPHNGPVIVPSVLHEIHRRIFDAVLRPHPLGQSSFTLKRRRGVARIVAL